MSIEGIKVARWMDLQVFLLQVIPIQELRKVNKRIVYVEGIRPVRGFRLGVFLLRDEEVGSCEVDCVPGV